MFKARSNYCQIECINKIYERTNERTNEHKHINGQMNERDKKYE